MGAERSRRERGFTLLEVMVALAVLAITLGALSKGIVRYLENAAYLRDRTLATWVAENRLAELQIREAWPEPDTTKGNSEMGGRRWYWLQIVSTVPERPEVRQVRIEIRQVPDSEHPVATLTGLLVQPHGR